VNGIRSAKGVSLVALFILLLSILSGCLQSLKTNSDSNGGEDFTFTALDNTEKHLSDYRGKVVILDMWATWCGPCRLQMIELNKIYENYSRNDLEIISIDVDSSENVQLVQSYRDWFVQYYGIELDWIFGKDDGSISEKYMRGGQIPTLAIFDQNGRLYLSEVGICVYLEIPPGLPENTTVLAPIIDRLID